MPDSKIFIFGENQSSHFGKFY